MDNNIVENKDEQEHAEREKEQVVTTPVKRRVGRPRKDLALIENIQVEPKVLQKRGRKFIPAESPKRREMQMRGIQYYNENIDQIREARKLAYITKKILKKDLKPVGRPKNSDSNECYYARNRNLVLYKCAVRRYGMERLPEKYRLMGEELKKDPQRIAMMVPRVKKPKKEMVDLTIPQAVIARNRKRWENIFKSIDKDIPDGDFILDVETQKLHPKLAKNLQKFAV